MATGLFSNVQVNRRGAQIVVSVQEQGGTVNRVAFEVMVCEILCKDSSHLAYQFCVLYM